LPATDSNSTKFIYQNTIAHGGLMAGQSADR
jgi:hypothetical protein